MPAPRLTPLGLCRRPHQHRTRHDRRSGHPPAGAHPPILHFPPALPSRPQYGVYLNRYERGQASELRDSLGRQRASRQL
ncbi:hypothetical protein SUS17_3766 [Sphingomonas sp. S17]|nr:hypothetical protein SUS17_3766 [Sphingomonas sp. S17]